MRPATDAQEAPAFVTVAGWRRLSGMSRTGTYEALARGNLVGRKLGGRTLIDAQAGLRWLHSLPPARIRLSGSPDFSA